MHDRRGDDHRDRDARHRDHHDGRDHHHGGPDGGPEQRGGDGADTRFLQLEMSQVLYGEAEGVTKQAFRELLVEASKAHMRERFGDVITGLAELATDELLADIEASLGIEEQIRQRHGSDDDDPSDRLRDVLRQRRSGRAEPAPEREPSPQRKNGGASSARKRRR